MGDAIVIVGIWIILFLLIVLFAGDPSLHEVLVMKLKEY